MVVKVLAPAVGLTLLAMLKTLQKGQLDFLIKCRMH